MDFEENYGKAVRDTVLMMVREKWAVVKPEYATLSPDEMLEKCIYHYGGNEHYAILDAVRNWL